MQSPTASGARMAPRVYRPAVAAVGFRSSGDPLTRVWTYLAPEHIV
jgi:hypothetical protein